MCLVFRGVLLVLGVVWLLGTPAVVHSQENPVVAIRKVTRGRLERKVRQAVTLFPYEQVKVYARATGYARKVHVDIGDEVEAGQLLLVLDIPEQEADLRAADAELSVAAAKVEKAHALVALKEAIFSLTSNLFEKGGRNKFQLEEAGAEKRLANAELRLAEALQEVALAGRERIKVLTSYGRVLAPFSGVVTARMVDTGALVLKGSSGGASALFEVQRVDKLRCRIEIPERDAMLVLQSYRHGTLQVGLEFDSQTGADAVLDPSDLTEATVRFAKSLHPLSHHMLAEIDLRNDERKLLPGLFGKATLTARGVSRENVILVPNTAVRAPRKAAPFVFLVEESKGGIQVVRKADEIKLGATDGSLTEVLEGLSAGDWVVVRGAATLLDSQIVTVGARMGETAQDGAGKEKG